MTLVQKMKAEKELLLNQIAILESCIKNSPDGSLSVVMNGRRVRWYLSKKPDEAGHNNRVYLAKKEKELAEALARKAYWKAKLNDCKKKVKAIEEWLKSNQDFVSEDEALLTKVPYIKRLLSKQDEMPDPVRTWLETNHKVNRY